MNQAIISIYSNCGSVVTCGCDITCISHTTWTSRVICCSRGEGCIQVGLGSATIIEIHLGIGNLDDLTFGDEIVDVDFTIVAIQVGIQR